MQDPRSASTCKVSLALALLVAGLSLACGAGPAPSGGSVDFHNVRVFDGESLLFEGAPADVRVIDGRIAAITRSPTPAPDGPGRTLLPGLIDAHVHLFYAQARSDALRFGVTTVIDMYGDPRVLDQARRQRRSPAPSAEADLWGAGVGVTVPGGHPLGSEFPRLGPDEDPDQYVADRVAEGSDFIKLIIEPGGMPPVPTLTPAQVQAVVSAAHRRDRRAVAHTETLASARTAIAAGADGLAHLMARDETDEAFVQLIAGRGAFVVATMSVIDCGGAAAAELLADARLRPFLSPAQTAALQGTRPRCHPERLAVARANLARVHAAGVPVLAGTDAGVAGVAQGVSLLGEIAQLARGGLSPSEALAAATSMTARRFGMEDRGAIFVGARGDLVLVEGDPTRELDDVRNIVGVFKNGVAVERRP
jgi:imidazolonepropionase-like amidohydrolase